MSTIELLVATFVGLGTLVIQAWVQVQMVQLNRQVKKVSGTVDVVHVLTNSAKAAAEKAYKLLQDKYELLLVAKQKSDDANT